MAGRQRTEHQQAAVIPYRPTADGPEVLLITSRSSGRWILPKGYVAEGETSRGCAAREAFEEAGIEGRVHPERFGSYSYRKNGRDHAVVVYLLEVYREHDQWPEDRCRKRRWLSLDRALDRVSDAALKQLLDRANRVLPLRRAA